jgi:drug/metabolite transporter (DMT)-like permease
MTKKTDFQADLILLITAAIWGLAFVFQRTGMDHIGPITFVFCRFVIAAIVILPIWYLMEKPKQVFKVTAVDKKAMLLGVLMAVGMLLQQAGLLYTTVSRAGFLTGVYIIFVPLIGLFLGNRTAWPTWLGIALSVVGLYFLAQIESDEFLFGDVLILVSAVVWALHVIYTGRRANEISVYRLMFIQFVVAGLISGLIMLLVETWNWQAVLNAGIALLYVGVLSSGVAFSLQVVGMRTAPASHAAIILSFEAVFAAIGGWWWLHEHLTLLELIGCALILLGGLVSQLKVFLKTSPAIEHPRGVN